MSKSTEETKEPEVVERITRDQFFEQLEDFDLDSFGKDNNFDNSDVYQVIQFFANKIYDSFEHLEANQKDK